MKSSNVLLGLPPGQTPSKLCDFGFARKINDDDPGSIVRGSPAWMAPEVMMASLDDVTGATTGQDSITAKADVFSFGVVLWEMLSGRMPWQGLTVQEVINEHSTACFVIKFRLYTTCMLCIGMR